MTDGDEYPQVSSTSPTDGEHHVTVRRHEYLLTRFRLYDYELGPLIDHLQSLQSEDDDD